MWNTIWNIYSKYFLNIFIKCCEILWSIYDMCKYCEILCNTRNTNMPAWVFPGFHHISQCFSCFTILYSGFIVTWLHQFADEGAGSWPGHIMASRRRLRCAGHCHWQSPSRWRWHRTGCSGSTVVRSARAAGGRWLRGRAEWRCPALAAAAAGRGHLHQAGSEAVPGSEAGGPALPPHPARIPASTHREEFAAPGANRLGERDSAAAASGLRRCGRSPGPLSGPLTLPLILGYPDAPDKSESQTFRTFPIF